MVEPLPPVFWIGFLAVILALLSLDLFVFHRTPHDVTVREAAKTSAFWIGLGLAFGLVVLAWRGPDLALQYYSGYLIEESLSIDNVFVFSLVFSAFAVPRRYQHRVLFWGVIGALVMRLVMILVGAALIERFSGILLVFGAFLVDHGVPDVEIDPERGPPRPGGQPDRPLRPARHPGQRPVRRPALPDPAERPAEWRRPSSSRSWSWR